MTLEYLIGGQEVVGSDPLFSRTSWNSTTFTLSVIKDCDDIEDDRKNNFKKKKYIYLKP